MNIKFDDEMLFFQLMDSALIEIPIGSTAYGMETEHSDKDILVIYAESEDKVNSFVQVSHQLQYKKDNTDYMFTTLRQFVNNLIRGDQTILYEAANHVINLDSSGLVWLYNHACSSGKTFDTYNIIKAYCGFAKRDIKNALKYVNETKDITSYTIRKKLSHILRGYLMAERGNK